MPRELSQSSAPFDVNYTAHFESGNIRFTVFAAGHNPTTGYRSFFQVDPTDILPATVDFINIRPTGMAGQMITPFNAQITMVATSILGQPQKAVTVHDSNGSQSIPIGPAPNPNP